MVAPSAGEVILVPFPFYDLSQLELRPAVCLADVARGDWVLCQTALPASVRPSLALRVSPHAGAFVPCQALAGR